VKFLAQRANKGMVGGLLE